MKVKVKPKFKVDMTKMNETDFFSYFGEYQESAEPVYLKDKEWINKRTFQNLTEFQSSIYS